MTEEKQANEQTEYADFIKRIAEHYKTEPAVIERARRAFYKQGRSDASARLWLILSKKFPNGCTLKDAYLFFIERAAAGLD